MLTRVSNMNQYNIYIIAPLDFKQDINSMVAQYITTRNWSINILHPLNEFDDGRESR
jgi:hypothetical protein